MSLFSLEKLCDTATPDPTTGRRQLCSTLTTFMVSHSNLSVTAQKMSPELAQTSPALRTLGTSWNFQKGCRGPKWTSHIYCVGDFPPAALEHGLIFLVTCCTAKIFRHLFYQRFSSPEINKGCYWL